MRLRAAETGFTYSDLDVTVALDCVVSGSHVATSDATTGSEAFGERADTEMSACFPAEC